MGRCIYAYTRGAFTVNTIAMYTAITTKRAQIKREFRPRSKSEPRSNISSRRDRRESSRTVGQRLESSGEKTRGVQREYEHRLVDRGPEGLFGRYKPECSDGSGVD